MRPNPFTFFKVAQTGRNIKTTDNPRVKDKSQNSMRSHKFETDAEMTFRFVKFVVVFSLCCVEMSDFTKSVVDQ